MAILPAAHKANGIGSPHLGTDPNATAAQNTIFIPERITDFLDPTAHREVLNRPGVRRLGDEQLCEVTPQTSYLVAVALDHHAFLRMQGAGSGNLRAAVFDVLDDAQAAGSHVGKGGDVA